MPSSEALRFRRESHQSSGGQTGPQRSRSAGQQRPVIELAATARTAGDAAGALGCQQGSIVKSLVFRVAGAPVLALIAGGRRARQERIAVALGLEGTVTRADADFVRQATGYSIGGVPARGTPGFPAHGDGRQPVAFSRCPCRCRPSPLRLWRDTRQPRFHDGSCGGRGHCGVTAP